MTWLSRIYCEVTISFISFQSSFVTFLFVVMLYRYNIITTYGVW